MKLLLAAGLAAIAIGCEAAPARRPESPNPRRNDVHASAGPLVPADVPTAAAPPVVRVPTASRRVLAAGTTVAIVEDRDAPRVAIRLSIAAGTSSDTERAGASIVAAHAMGMTIEDRVADLGGHVEVAIGPDAAVFSVDVAPDAASAAIDALASLAKGAAPPASLLSRATRRASLEAKRLGAEDDDHGAAYVIVRDAHDLPTARHPYGTASATAAEIAAVTSADVRLITAARYVAASATLVLVGDVAASDAMALAERAFSGASTKPLPRLDLTEPFARDHDRVTLIDRPGASSAHVIVGLPGPSADDATALAGVELAIEIVAGRLDAGTDASARMYAFDQGPQIARIDLRTNPRRASEEVRRVQHEIELVATEAPAPDTLVTAKRRILGRDARALSTSDGVADALARHPAAGALERRLEAIASATPEVVSIAAQALAQVRAHVVVSADAKTAAQALTSVAEVKVIDPLADYARLRSVQAAR